MTAVRRPAVAGLFYPAEPAHLHATVDQLLAPKVSELAPPKALIVPHAGYIYSGPTAATAYGRLYAARERISRVVLLGPAHFVPLRGLAAPTVDAFATPLGEVRLDRAALDALKDLPQVRLNDGAHGQEHSLEVQLPFLQRLLPAFTLVPLVVGDASPAEVAEVLERLWGGEETLILISSDLSHYHDYATARELDARTSANIERLRFEALEWEDACGRVPIQGLLYYARRHGLKVETLELCNSGDTAGDKRRVVGYGAYAVQ